MIRFLSLYLSQKWVGRSGKKKTNEQNKTKQTNKQTKKQGKKVWLLTLLENTRVLSLVNVFLLQAGKR